MSQTDCPIACTLSDSAFRVRRNDVVQKIVPAIIETKELENGFAYRFPADDEWLLELAQFVIFERKCCAFLSFKLSIESGQVSIWLELTGQPGAKDFIASLLN
ncbi:MAG: hypothetical protein ABI954_15625 [Pyrinomonadaceae bacterium]